MMIRWIVNNYLSLVQLIYLACFISVAQAFLFTFNNNFLYIDIILFPTSINIIEKITSLN